MEGIHFIYGDTLCSASLPLHPSLKHVHNVLLLLHAEASIFSLPAIAEVRSGVSMSPEALHQAPFTLNLVMATHTLVHTQGFPKHIKSSSSSSNFSRILLISIDLKKGCKGNNSENDYEVQRLLAKVKDTVANG